MASSRYGLCYQVSPGLKLTRARTGSIGWSRESSARPTPRDMSSTIVYDNNPLTRTFRLLDKGSTQLIRNTAASQLADVQKQNPENLFALLGRVLPYLQSKSWDTRTAAAKALGAIIDNAQKFDPNADDPDTKSDPIKTQDIPLKEEDSDPTSDDLFQLDLLDMRKILRGKLLLGSAGKEYDFSIAGMTPAQRLAHQKQSLNSRLGLAGEYIEHDLVTENDFAASSQNKAGPPSGTIHIDTKAALDRSTSQSNGSPLAVRSPDGTPVDETSLSKRQLNQLKRKNKTAAKAGASKMRVVDLSGRRPTEPTHSPASAGPHPVKLNGNEDANGDVKPDFFNIKREGPDDDTALVSEFKGDVVPEKPLIQPDDDSAQDWPFDVMCDFLSVDLFDPNWEIRHGAAMGLREVMRAHGRGAGRHFGKSRAQNDLDNKRYLGDLAYRLLCVLMLDRFGDYVSDTVVAPIRESIGQTLGALLSQLPDESAMMTYHILQQMIDQKDIGQSPIWEVCHGGMIGLRYFVAVRKDLLLQHNTIIDGVVSAAILGLGHMDDDVKSVSAATIIPIAGELTKMRSDALGRLICVVWDCMLDMQDDLSASTGAVMDLLATLCSYDETLEAMRANAVHDPEQSFDRLVPRLYPFLRHTITSVRMAVLKALATFMNVSNGTHMDWIDGRLTRLVFQNMLLERNEAVLWTSFDVWQALLASVERSPQHNLFSSIEPHVSSMLKATIQPIGQERSPIPMDTSLLIKPSGAPMAVITSKHSQSQEPDHQPKKKRKLDKPESNQHLSHNTDGHMLHGEVDLVGTEVMIRSRIACARALGLLLGKQAAPRFSSYWTSLLPDINSPNSSSRLFTGLLFEELARTRKVAPDDLPTILASFQRILDDDGNHWYFDIVASLQAARGQCVSLVGAFQTNAHVARDKLPAIAVVCQGENGAGPKAFSLADAERIVTTDFDRLLKGLTASQRISGVQYLNDARANATTAVEEAKRVKNGRDQAIKASVASILVRLGEIPKKPGQLIKSIMDSIKGEENEELQARSASAVAALIDYYTHSPKRGPVDKLVSNLVKFTCVDTAETPEFAPNAAFDDVVLSLRKEEDRKDHPDAARFEQEAKEARVMRRGAKRALDDLALAYGSDLLQRLPVLKGLIAGPIEQLIGPTDPATFEVDDEQGQTLVDAFSILRTMAPSLHLSLHPWILTLTPLIGKAMRSRLSVIRYSAAKCFATLCSVIPVEAMTMLVKEVLPNIGNPLDLRDRQGITECVYHLIQVMGDRILPYVIFLIVPVLGRMSDANSDVRLLATTSFATLVKLVPLEAGIPDPPGMPEELLLGRERERKFMAQMLDPKKVESFTIPVAIKAELRSYQQDGVNWLAFLNKYNLHGVLCDDMGLGKTLQTLCIVASDHHIRAEEYSRSQAPDMRRLPSLIVCPPTLSGHWQQEIKQYAPFLSCVAYVGSPAERGSRRQLLETADIVITSYDVCRNDTDVLQPITWNYCVLDEGHLIKNPKAKISQAVKKLISNHRLILSGTPIQNNVLELWSLFDFLMPGFLGTERVFQDRFAKPIAASRNAKSSSKEQEAGALAIESLHKQVLPFLLRRLKEEVLNDLPPKILQNYYCDLSELQRRLFEDFFKKERTTVENSVGSTDKGAKQHIFQALQYMRKLCNSPALVVKEGNKQYDVIQKQLAQSKSHLRDIAHAPKLGALRDLLVDCGIGVNNESNDMSATNYVSQHRALIFCQMKEMLDMVQNEVLGKLLPGVQFLRLDGSVEATKRQNIVNQFNNDPSYDCLLLTTSVGGLGLNLTGADTVIFVEHDWNPQKDIQAMDRAHRIGQKKVVNVYRLITRGTLEEKILSLQRFKIDVASTVVNQQNAGLGSMETDQILDLFNLAETSETAGESGGAGREEDMVDVETGEVKKKGEKGWLDDVGDLWDERQYQEEFNLDSFVQNLQK